ncbi:MAG: NUDIX domain-containing protein [Chloroflexota bacterium]
MIVRQAGGVVLLGDQVVLRRTARGEYLFPKGHVEPGESMEETARREVAEEVGLEAEIVAPLGDVDFSYQGDDYRVTMFLMRATRRLPEWADHLERDTVVAARDQLPSLLSFESYRQLWSRAEKLL